MSCRGLLAEAEGISFEGYEIHMGSTESDGEGIAFRLRERSGQSCDLFDGYLDDSGHVLGTYIHGLFQNKEVRWAILKHISYAKGQHLSLIDDDPRQNEYDRLADLVSHSLNMDLLCAIIGLSQGK